VNRIFCCCARRVGNMYFLIEAQDGSPVVVAGPCWPFCVGVTVPLIVGISAAVIVLVVLNPAAGLVRIGETLSSKHQPMAERSRFDSVSAKMGSWHLFSHTTLYLGGTFLCEL
jgi:hypothetical protein